MHGEGKATLHTAAQAPGIATLSTAARRAGKATRGFTPFRDGRAQLCVTLRDNPDTIICADRVGEGQEKTTMLKTPQIQWCSHCQMQLVRRRDLCGACDNYRRRHGTPRPARYFPKERQIIICRCGDLAFGNGRCRKCDNYWYSKGKERPEFLYSKRLCKNKFCHRPCPMSKIRRGLCAACWDYQRKHGAPRPRTLILRHAPKGWCECGRPAVRVEEFEISGFMIAVRVCKKCDQ